MLWEASELIYYLILYQEGNKELDENYKQQYGFGGAMVWKLVDGIITSITLFIFW